MRNLIVILTMSVFTFLYGNVLAQDGKEKKDDREPRNLRGNLMGKWELTDSTSNASAGVWEFQRDGKFQSTGHFLSTKDASFRTDESRSVVYIQVGEEITEWRTTIISDGIILMEITPDKKTKPKEFHLKKIEDN
jgi:hypothetical protein